MASDDVRQNTQIAVALYRLLNLSLHYGRILIYSHLGSEGNFNHLIIVSLRRNSYGILKQIIAADLIRDPDVFGLLLMVYGWLSKNSIHRIRSR
jgi:hypothetical protein